MVGGQRHRRARGTSPGAARHPLTLRGEGITETGESERHFLLLERDVSSTATPQRNESASFTRRWKLDTDRAFPLREA